MLLFSVTLNFFDDILIPADSLQHPSQFNEDEQVWVWQFSDGGGDEESHDLFMDIGEEIRFRVINEAFTDTSPTGPEGKPCCSAPSINSELLPKLGLSKLSEHSDFASPW